MVWVLQFHGLFVCSFPQTLPRNPENRREEDLNYGFKEFLTCLPRPQQKWILIWCQAYLKANGSSIFYPKSQIPARCTTVFAVFLVFQAVALYRQESWRLGNCNESWPVCVMGIQGNATFPARNNAFFRDYQGIMVVNQQLIRPYFVWGRCI